MATHNLTYEFGNNFENEASAGTVSVPAEIRGAGTRGLTPPVFVGAGDVVESYTVPANCVVTNLYLVVKEAMTGTVDVTFAGVTTHTGADISAEGLLLPDTWSELYITTPEKVELTFSDAQTAGEVSVVFEFIQVNTNTAKYINK